MKHQGTKLLETERLILRRFEVADAAAMFKNWASDPEVTKFLMWPTHSDVKVTEAVLSNWVGNYSDDKYYHWAIVPKDLGEAIGSIAAVEQEESTGMFHIGYCIGRNWWGMGITAEALQALMDYFFDEIGAERIESRHDPRNPNSGKVMMKCGMKYEGTHRRADWNNQGVCDAAYYAILKDER